MKNIILIISLLFLQLGCKKVEVNNENYIELVNNCLVEYKITNNVSLGYKYYVPKGVKKIKDFDYNQIFLIEDSKVYLYVDVISYFYNRKLSSENKENVFYFQEFNFNEKQGFVKIENKENNEYFVSIVYNYAKIEFYSSYENLDKLITMSSIILNSIEYNDAIIEKILEGDFGEFSEFTYEVDKPEDASSNFTQYLEESVQKEEVEQLPD